MTDPKEIRAAKAEQALRILEAIERATKTRGNCAVQISRSVVGLRNPRITLWDFMGERLEFTGVNVTDALAQLATFTDSVIDEMGWSEPGVPDAESDVEAFDRVVGKGEAAE